MSTPDETLQLLVAEFAEPGVRSLTRALERLVAQAVVELGFLDRLDHSGLWEPGQRHQIVISRSLAEKWLS